MRYTVLLVAFCCFLSSGMSQSLRAPVAIVLQSALSPQQKVDSLYKLCFADYHTDYSYYLQVADTVLALSERNAYKEGEGKAHILLALVYEGLGNLNAVNIHASKALQFFSAAPVSKELALALFSQGSYYRRKKKDKDAAETFLRCLEVSQSIGDKKMESTAYTSLGILSVGQKQYEKALEYYGKALDIAQHTQDRGREQRTYTNMGIVYMRQLRYEASIAAHIKALALARELGAERDEAFVFNDLGAVYLASDGNIDSAITYLKKSISIRESINEISELPYTYSYLGQAYGKRGDKANAFYWIKKALQTADHIGNDKQRYEALDELATQHGNFNRYDSAYHYLKLHNLLRDSVRKAEQAEALAELSVQYETNKKEQAIALLTRENTIQQMELRQGNLYLSLSLLLVAGALLTTWLVYRTRKLKEEKLRNEAALQEELLRLEAQNALQQDRLRISRELHDNIGANLTVIHSAVDEANARTGDGEHLEDVKLMLNDTIAELRRTVWLINKPSVTLEEWVVKLRDYFRKLPKVQISTNTINEAGLLSSNRATVLFRIIQEAVNNSVKHSNASEIIITIHTDAAGIYASVADNGRGFDTGQKAVGYGLNNMQQNAVEAGGNVTIESITGKGTCVRTIIPW